jgi:hypothetical protein
MKWLLRTEGLALFGASLYLFSATPFAWWWYAALFLAPDLGMLGYLAGNRAGAAFYNLTHHYAMAIGLCTIGLATSWSGFYMVGLICLGHSGFDRALGYGLKYAKGFRYTHLGELPGSPQK